MRSIQSLVEPRDHWVGYLYNGMIYITLMDIKDKNECFMRKKNENEAAPILPQIEEPHGSKNAGTPPGIGWNNLVAIIAVLSVLRSVILNILDYGFIMEIPLSKLQVKDIFKFSAFIILNGLRCLAFYLLVTGHRGFGLGFITLTEAGLAVFVFHQIEYVYFRFWAHTFSVITDLKLISYCLERGSVALKEFTLFMAVPTLVFKPPYSHTCTADYRRVSRKIIEFSLYFILFVFFMDQYAIPSIYNIMEFNSVFSLVENCINLSISTILLFILFFLLVFNCFLVVLGELTGFKEMTFRDWWNSTSASEFWRSWNIPVHRFVTTYLYKPIAARGVSRMMTTMICFTVSGLLHEYVTALAMKKATGYMFLAMIAQAPLMYISDAFQKKFPMYGNLFFWLSFSVLGQPLIVLFIFRSHYIERSLHVLS